MQELQEIVEVTVDQQTTTLAEPSFSIPAIVALFDEADFSGWTSGQRHKFYATDAEMSDDGIPADHIVRVAFNKLIGQSPTRVEKVLVGREDSADSTIADTMNAIADEQPEFFMVSYKVARGGKFTFAADLVANNVLDFIIETGGDKITEIPTVVFNTDMATTLGDIKNTIEANVPGASVTVDVPSKSFEITIKGTSIASMAVSITGGASEVATFDVDFVTGNEVSSVITLNGATVLDLVVTPFDTDHATTIGNLAAAIGAALTTAGVTGVVSTADAVARTVTVSGANIDTLSIVHTVTGGAAQPVATYATISPTSGSFAVDGLTTAEEAKYQQMAAWVQANERMQIFVTSDSDASANPYDASLPVQPDLGAWFRANGYGLTCSYFDKAEPTSELDVAVAGENLPYGPAADGSANTWSFKTPAGVAAKVYTSSERSNLESKFYNVFTPKAGQNCTLFNFCADGEPIEAKINIFWTTFLIQRNVFTQLLNKRAVPLNDNGMLTIIGKIAEATDEAEQKGALVPGETTITYPKFSELPEADRNAGIFSGIVVEAKIQRAIQKVKVRFVITA